jgi:glycosyltransferase involved in cell wall biosynthesis
MFKGTLYRLKNLLKKPFKIGIITAQYPEKNVSNQGVAIHVSYLTKELASLGCEVHVFTNGSKTSKKVEYIKEGKRVIHRINTSFKFPIQNSVIEKKLSRIIFDNQVMDAILKENSNENFNILHSHITIFGALMSKYFNDVKWVHTFHSLEKNRLKFMSKEQKRYLDVERWYESALSYADALITVSQNLKANYIKNYDPEKKQKVCCIPNGVDAEVFKPDENVKEEEKITCVGRFSMEKGVDIIPKIASKVLSKNKELKFVAVFPPEKLIHNTLNPIKGQFETLEKTFPDRFIWIKEPIGREELAKLYNESAIYIQPSRYESFGMTVLEAMACGKAVITSNRGGLPEVVGNAGLTIKLNSNIFAREILKLLESPKLRKRLGLRGVQRAKLFSWEKIAKETLELYQVLAKKKPEEEQERIAEGFNLLSECENNDSKVSVIIPVFNAEKFIEKSINSVLDQTCQNFEIIVVDDASTDDSLKIIKKMSKQNDKIKIIEHKQNTGRAGAMNSGLKEAKGNYIAFLDADDIIEKEKLNEQIKVFERNKNIDMTYTDLREFDEKGEGKIWESVDFKTLKEPLKRLQESAKSKGKFKYTSQILDKDKFIPGGSVMIRKKIISRGIKFDEELKNSEDCDFNFKIIGAGYKIKRIPKVLYFYRQHPNQKSNDKGKMQIAKKYITKKLRAGKYF